MTFAVATVVLYVVIDWSMLPLMGVSLMEVMKVSIAASLAAKLIGALAGATLGARARGRAAAA